MLQQAHAMLFQARPHYAALWQDMGDVGLKSRDLVQKHACMVHMHTCTCHYHPHRRMQTSALHTNPSAPHPTPQSAAWTSSTMGGPCSTSLLSCTDTGTGPATQDVCALAALRPAYTAELRRVPPHRSSSLCAHTLPRFTDWLESMYVYCDNLLLQPPTSTQRHTAPAHSLSDWATQSSCSLPHFSHSFTLSLHTLFTPPHTAPASCFSFFSSCTTLRKFLRPIMPNSAAPAKLALAAVPNALTLSTVPTLTSVDASSADPITLIHACTLTSALSASRALTRSLRSPRSRRSMVDAISSILLGPLNRFTTARFWLAALFLKSSTSFVRAGAPSSSSSLAYGAAISLMSKRGSRLLPMPSSTVKERTTKVKVAGNLNGWSFAASSRSSPMVLRICLRRSLPSSLLRWGLKDWLYSAPRCARSARCWSSRSWKLLRKNSAVLRIAVRSPVGTYTPIITRASRQRSGSRL
mmetsp:Transcript_29729/g.65784  ORF Transcript_29729/g.65784 Transcript_29729/m.65784 type:complete len:467 (+) Transcript_29729:586-1986(+)